MNANNNVMANPLFAGKNHIYSNSMLALTDLQDTRVRIVSEEESTIFYKNNFEKEFISGFNLGTEITFDTFGNRPDYRKVTVRKVTPHTWAVVVIEGSDNGHDYSWSLDEENKEKEESRARGAKLRKQAEIFKAADNRMSQLAAFYR